MYHALAGHPPYEVGAGGAAVLGVLYRIAHEPPPRLRDAGWMGPLLELTMSHDPAARPAMADVAAYLRTRIATGRAPDHTLALPAAGAGVVEDPDPVTATAFLPPPPPAGTAAAAPPPPPERDRAGGPGKAVLIGLAVVAALAAIGMVLLLTGGDDKDPGVAADRGSTTAPDDKGSEESASEPTDPTTEAEPPTAEELEEFATTYVATADSDPDAGFAMLTPDYQARSGEYADFWGPMSNPRILNVKADPEAMTVTYSYKYDFPDGKRTERVTLFLVQEGDQLLIADAN
jgi:hypothetical protein